MREWKTFLFCIITTFQVVFIALSNALLGNKNLTLNITQLAGIPFVAFMSVLPVLIYVHKENVSRTELTVYNFRFVKTKIEKSRVADEKFCEGGVYAAKVALQ